MAVNTPVGALRRRARLLALHPAAAPLGALAAGIAASLYLSRADPHQPGHLLPRCPFNWSTGLLCPVCGGTRMAYDLTHADLTTALHDNAALLLAVPLVLFSYGRWLLAALRGGDYRPRLGKRGTVAVVAVAAVWAVARNLVSPFAG